jgi:hypothetical protein
MSHWLGKHVHFAQRERAVSPSVSRRTRTAGRTRIPFRTRGSWVPFPEMAALSTSDSSTWTRRAACPSYASYASFTSLDLKVIVPAGKVVLINNRYGTAIPTTATGASIAAPSCIATVATAALRLAVLARSSLTSLTSTTAGTSSTSVTALTAARVDFEAPKEVLRD